MVISPVAASCAEKGGEWASLDLRDTCAGVRPDGLPAGAWPSQNPWYLGNLGLSWPDGKGRQKARLPLVPTGSSPLLKSSPKQKTFLPEPQSQICTSGTTAGPWKPVGCWEHGKGGLALLTPHCTLCGPSAEAFSQALHFQLELLPQTDTGRLSKGRMPGPGPKTHPGQVPCEETLKVNT